MGVDPTGSSPPSKYCCTPRVRSSSANWLPKKSNEPQRHRAHRGRTHRVETRGRWREHSLPYLRRLSVRFYLCALCTSVVRFAMDKNEVAIILDEIGTLLEIQGEN